MYVSSVLVRTSQLYVCILSPSSNVPAVCMYPQSPASSNVPAVCMYPSSNAPAVFFPYATASIMLVRLDIEFVFIVVGYTKVFRLICPF